MHSSLRNAIARLCQRAIETEYPKLVLKYAHCLSGKKTWLYFDKGLNANARYIEATVPEVLVGGMSVLDVGAGPGHFLLLCRELGNEVAGVDRPCSVFDPADQPSAYKALTDNFALEVQYIGLEDWIDETNGDHAFDLINFRGSMDGVLASLLDGHKPEVIQQMLADLRALLKPGGAIVVSHNPGVWCDDFRRAIEGGVPGYDKMTDMPTLTRLVRREVVPEVVTPSAEAEVTA